MKTEQRPQWQWVLAVAVVAVTGQHARCQQAEPLATLRGHPGLVSSLAFSPDGRMLASAGVDDGSVKLWEVVTGKERASLKGHPNGAYAVAFSPRGRLLASGGRDSVVRLWDNAGRPSGSLKHGEGVVLGLSYSPDDTSLAVGMGKEPLAGQLRLWDLRTGTERLALRGRVEWPGHVAFSGDGRMVATGDHSGVVTLWEVASGKVRARFRGHRGFVWSVAFVRGVELLASSGRDGRVRLWDLRSGKQRTVLKGHNGHATCLAATARLLSSGGTDGTVRLWDTGTEGQLLVLKVPGPVYSLAFSLDGRLLAAGDLYGTIRLWPVAKLLAQKGRKK